MSAGGQRSATPGYELKLFSFPERDTYRRLPQIRYNQTVFHPIFGKLKIVFAGSLLAGMSSDRKIGFGKFIFYDVSKPLLVPSKPELLGTSRKEGEIR